MAIVFDQAAKTITLHTANTSYQIKIAHEGILLHTYYGPRAEGDMSYAIGYCDRGFEGNPFDAGMDRTVSCSSMPLEYPCEGNGDYRFTAFGVRDARGVSGCDLRYAGHRILAGKYSLPGMPAVFAQEEAAMTLEVTLRDVRLPLEVKLLYGVLEDVDCVTRTAVVANLGEEALTIENAASTSVDFLSGDFDMIQFFGRHVAERMPERMAVSHGEHVFGSRRGTSSHHMNPFVVLADRRATEDHGLCLGAALVWSGSFSGRVGRDSIDQTRLTLGVQSERFNYELIPGERFVAPEAVMIMTDRGLAALSHRFHQLAHDHIIRSAWKDIARPVLINNWEATYMDFTGEKLLSIARKASELGVDMMVLDDGWFGRRSDDHDGLGDWTVNEAKLGCTMKELADRIKALGMRFGLWIEPEMVNMASDLYKEHPDRAFAIPGKPPVRSRDQLVLDFSRREVVDYIAKHILECMKDCGIDYVKMDMNRSVNDVYTLTQGMQSQGKVLYKYMLGVYDFIQRLLDANPGLLLEGCSGGGGRFDLGMLFYSPQIWCSDNTDPIERLMIQYGTSFAYPPSSMGAHVSVSPNEQTGRVTPLNTRGVVAMAGTFGYELDLNLLSDEEKTAVTQQIRTFKKYQMLIRHGRYYRLTDCVTNKDEAAWMFVSEDRKEALVSIVRLSAHDNAPMRYVRCKGLEPDAVYIDEETGLRYTGAMLMYQGIAVPRAKEEYQAAQLHFVQA